MWNSDTLMLILAVVGAYLAIPWDTVKKLFPKAPDVIPEDAAKLKDAIDKLINAFTGDQTKKVTEVSVTTTPVPAKDQLTTTYVHVCALIKAAQDKKSQPMLDDIMAFWSKYVHIEPSGDQNANAGG